LDGERKRSVLQFLYEAQLINRPQSTFVEGVTYELGPARIVGLSGADLTSADLRYIYLSDTALNGALLDDADLREAKLSDIDLGGAYLSGADLSYADLRGASLVNAELQRKDELNLSGANLSGANLSGADLSGADLSGASLSGTNLYEATGWTEEQLRQARSLKGATMPNGQKYEDWIKDRESNEEDTEKE
jgi:uncharacterized protein YjbI with pentapeptide repeats